MRRGWEMEVRQREGGGVGGGKSKRRAMRLGSRCGWGGGVDGEGRRAGEVVGWGDGGRGGLKVWGAHYVFHGRIWNPINQAEERRDAERMRSPFTLMRPGQGKRSTT